jgi:hypothetical protein
VAIRVINKIRPRPLDLSNNRIGFDWFLSSCIFCFGTQLLGGEDCPGILIGLAAIKKTGDKVEINFQSN